MFIYIFTDQIFKGDGFSNIHLGETHVLCPSNHTGFNSHVHVNETTFHNQNHNDDFSMTSFSKEYLVTDDLPPMFEQIWNKNTVPFFLLFLFPLISLRSVTFFTKFNCVGKW